MKNRLFWALVGLFILLFAASWFFLFVGGFPSPLPMGTIPILALAGAMLSFGAFLLDCIVVLALYALVFLCLVGASRGKRLASAILLLMILADMAINVLFTFLSLWYFATAAGDFVLMVLVLRLSFQYYKEK